MENRDWKDVKLEELIKFGNGKQRPDTEGLIPVYGGNGILSYTNSNNYDGETLIIGRVGAYCGAVYYDNRPIWISDNALSGKPKVNYDTKFLYYFLKNLDLNQYAGGSSHPLVTQTLLNSLEFKVCINHKEQKAIASVLSSLDDKIDLLNQQNQTLEALAETLFRQWFIEEAKEDWEEIKFGDVVTVKRGGSPRPIQDYLSDSGYRWLKISDATKENSPFIFDIKEHIKVEGLNKTTYLEAGKLVLSNSATPGLPKILQVDTCIHDGWLHFPKSKFSNEFLYLFFKKIRPELENMGNGSIFTNLKTDILKEFELRLPDDQILQKFDVIIKDYFDKILSNQKQIQTLTKLRDTLLPKLMSGEVRVKM